MRLNAIPAHRIPGLTHALEAAEKQAAQKQGTDSAEDRTNTAANYKASHTANHTESDAPWYASLLLALGAWITSLIGIGAVVALVELADIAQDETTYLVVGLVLLLAALAMTKRATGLFAQQACLVGILAGQGLTVGATYALTNEVIAASLASITISALIILRHPVISLSFITTLASLGLLSLGLNDVDVPYWIDLMAVVTLPAGVWLALHPPGRRRWARWWQGQWTGTAYALLLTVPVLGILLHLGDGDSRHLNDLFLMHDHAPFAAGWVAKLTLVALALYALNRIQPAWPVRQTRMASWLITGLVLAQPLGGAAASVLMVVAYLLPSPALMTIMATAQIIAIGQFYYELDISLLHKAGILAAIGTIALIGWWALFTRHTVSQPDQSKPQNRFHPVSMAVIVLSFLATTTVAGQAVLSREAIIAKGTRILMPLAPVDPRSLIQGDYMILRLDPDVLPTAQTEPRVGLISLDIADDGTVIGRSTPTATNGTISLDRLPGASRQVKLAYHPQRGGFGRRGTLGYGIDSFFFQEGQASAFNQARFAILRVSDDGQAVLVGLADGSKQRINPETTSSITN